MCISNATAKKYCVMGSTYPANRWKSTCRAQAGGMYLKSQAVASRRLDRVVQGLAWMIAMDRQLLQQATGFQVYLCGQVGLHLMGL